MSRPPVTKPPRSPLTYWRLRRRLTLKALSEATGGAISLPHVAAVETNRRGASPAIWAALAKALDVTVAQIRPPDADDALQASLFPLDQYVEIVVDPHDPT